MGKYSGACGAERKRDLIPTHRALKRGKYATSANNTIDRYDTRWGAGYFATDRHSVLSLAASVGVGELISTCYEITRSEW